MLLIIIFIIVIDKFINYLHLIIIITPGLVNRNNIFSALPAVQAEFFQWSNHFFLK